MTVEPSSASTVRAVPSASMNVILIIADLCLSAHTYDRLRRKTRDA
jgi:hypothetical protein